MNRLAAILLLGALVFGCTNITPTQEAANSKVVSDAFQKSGGSLNCAFAISNVLQNNATEIQEGKYFYANGSYILEFTAPIESQLKIVRKEGRTLRKVNAVNTGCDWAVLQNKPDPADDNATSIIAEMINQENVKFTCYDFTETKDNIFDTPGKICTP